MKYIVFIAIAVFLFATTACEQETLNHTQVSPVTDLYAPDDNNYMNLEAQSNAVFEWKAARAEDNGVVLYEVAFDREEGDFSAPVYALPSDGNGLQRTLTLSFGELNRIAGMAGIQPEASGKLKWTVLSSKGINVQAPATFRTIEVKRSAGIPAPDELYLAGSATEKGESLGDALLMKKTEENVYEIYTRLSAGEYYFAARNEGDPLTYAIGADGKLKAEGTTAF